jgi:cobalamin biosynthesis Mg chelatase CobN
MFPRILVTVVLTALAVPGLAQAQSSVAPPGNSAVDQYRESVPSTPASGPKKVPKETRRALREQGAAGRDLAAVLAKNGGVAAATTSGGAGDSDAGTGSAGTGSGRDSGSGGDSGSSPAGGGAGGSSTAPGAGEAPSPPASSSGAGNESTAQAAATSTTQAAATSTVGPLPVWAMVLAAFVVVGIGLVVRRRPAA